MLFRKSVNIKTRTICHPFIQPSDSSYRPSNTKPQTKALGLMLTAC